MEGAASETIERVADLLANRPVLLVLDNCEHVLERAAALVDRMLESGDAAHVLATSREPLGVVGEHVWPLGPLHEAGPALFVERARAAEPRVQWDPADPAVVELCRRLDDVPLALELAAGQLRRFDLDELNRRLDDRLALLWGSAAVDAQRHATMETAIDWSYRLLDAERAMPAPAPQRLPVVVRRRRRGGIRPSAAERGGRHRVRSTGRQEPRRAPARLGSLPAARDDPGVRQGPSGRSRGDGVGLRAAPASRAGADRVVVASGPVVVGAPRSAVPHRSGGRATGVPAQPPARQRRRCGRDRHRSIVSLAPGVGLCRGRHMDRRVAGSRAVDRRPAVGAPPPRRHRPGTR